MKQAAKKIGLVLVNLFAVAAILLAAVAFYGVFTSKEGEAPVVFGHAVLLVVSHSMEPAYPQNSLLLVKQTPFAEAQVGDVISFYSQDPTLDGRLNTHRVAEIREEAGQGILITKGDANSEPDLYPVTAPIFLGTVVWCAPAVGRFLTWIQGKYVFPLLIILPLLLIVGLCVRTLVHTYRREKALAEDEARRICQEAMEAQQKERERR